MKIQSTPKLPNLDCLATRDSTPVDSTPVASTPLTTCGRSATKPIFSMGYWGVPANPSSTSLSLVAPPKLQAKVNGGFYSVTPKASELPHTTLSRLANKLRIAGYNVSIADHMITVFEKKMDSSGKTQLIIDTDMALDDWPAILYIARHPSIDLRGITVTGAGEAHTEPGVNGALKLLALSGLEPQNIPVAGGRETPLAGTNTFPAQWRHEADTMFGLPLPETMQAPSDSNAVSTLIEMVESAPEPINILTLGPLTNLAEAIQKQSNLIDNIKMVTIMGGAVRVKGNLIVPGFTDSLTNDTAEWNLYIDSLAAKIVFESGLPITLVPLDATNSVQVTKGLLDTLEKHHPNPASDFVYNELKKNQGFIATGEFYLWDPTAAVVSANQDKPIGTVETLGITVETEAGDSQGKTSEDAQGIQMNVYTNADPKTTFNDYLQTLTGEPDLYDEILRFNSINSSSESSHD